MPDRVPRVRLFVGGPSDVSEERNAVVSLIKEELSREFKDLKLEPFTWDDPDQPIGFSTKSNPQQMVNQACHPSSCDIVVMLFKWRFGSPMNLDGKDYLSASQYELECALENPERPVIIFRYHKDFGDPVPQGRNDEEYKRNRREIEEGKRQFHLLHEFFTDLEGRHGKRLKINYYRDVRFVVSQAHGALQPELKRIEAWQEHKEASKVEAPRFDGYPFRGLFDFEYSHREVFFGRSGEIDELVKRLVSEDSPHLLIIHGDSGVGKSSLMKAGLLPRLIEGSVPAGGGEWRQVTFEPLELEGNPFLSFASAVKTIDSNKYGLISNPAHHLSQTLHDLSVSSEDAGTIRLKMEALVISPLLAGSPAGSQLIVAINQAEDLLNVSDQFKLAFVKFIAIMAESSNVRFICTLRTDTRNEFENLAPLKKVLQSAASEWFPLYPPDRNQLEDMIEKPAKAAGVEIEKKLITRLLDDAMGAKEGALPLVGYTLQTLRLEQGSNPLTFNAYETLGGLTGAVSKLAGEASGQTTRESLEALFEHLAEIRNGMLSRRIAQRSEIEAARIDLGLINVLARKRLLRSTEIDREPAVQLAHAALFQAWPDLKSWVEKSEAKLKLRDEVERDALVWVETGRRLRFIKLRGERLDEIRAIAAADPTFVAGNAHVREYLTAAEAQRQSEKLIASINGGHLTGIVDAIKAGGHLEIEDRNGEPGGVRPQFWAAITGDDRQEISPREDLTSDGDGPLQSKSIFEDPRIIRSTVGRGMSVPHLAALCGRLELLKKLADKDPAAMHLISEGGNTVLSAAAFGGHLPIVKYLLEVQKADPNILDEFGYSSAFWAYQQNHPDVVAYLKQHGASLEISSEEGWNLLTEAARSGDVAEVRDLLSKGVPVDYATKSGITPLIVACGRGHIDIVKQLIEAGAAPNRQNEQGYSPLLAALGQTDPRLIDVLIECGASIDITDENGSTALLHAASQGKVDFVDRLLLRNAKWDIANRDSIHPLASAAANGYGRIVQMLLSAGEDVNRPAVNHWTALHYTCDDGDVDTARILLKHPRVLVNAREKAGWTPLMCAVKKGHSEVVELMVEAGANRKLLNPAGMDALALAIQYNSLPAVKSLLSSELSLDRDYRLVSTAMLGGSSRRVSVTPLAGYPNADHLSLAVSEGNLEIVRTLLAAGADPKLRDNFGDTALHHAARFGYLEIATLLLSKEAPVSVQDREGRSAIDNAYEAGNTALAVALIEHGAVEPATWHRLKVSDEASFLTFEDMPEDRWARLHYQFSAQSTFVVRLEHMRLRAAPLPFYRNVYLVAAEDTGRHGPREQFALLGPDDDFIMLDWTNEPIYEANERWGIHLEDDRSVVQYCYFFFHFVRGKLGRFLVTENADRIRWTSEATDEVRDAFRANLETIGEITRPGNDQIHFKTTVVFKNALFRTGVLVAASPIRIRDSDGNEEKFSFGQLKLYDEELLMEELPIEIDGQPSVFG
ncbi:ankyrin repeat domain-containing protein [Granulicella aggregans]|uniref:ankyrin repeat domain-containing protein n=1 Tax=Granulicella aggregans TaxID=474949 RepID=UPI0021E00705|nr:ankyrin repeat domain-containing protein [Granulicella aggregans]